VEATAEVTTVSVDNMKLLHTGRVAIAFTLPDTAWEAHQGQLKGLREKVPVRTLAALYSNYLHIVALEGSGINGMSDLKGKRVSTGAPGSGTEIKGLRVMEAYGLSPKDLRSQERLGAGESAGALKDRKIDAFIWDGGLPTAAVLDHAATPGIKIRLISHGDAVSKMVAKYGPLYFVGTILKAAATNLLVVHEKMEESLACQITKAIFQNTKDLIVVHEAAAEVALKNAVVGKILSGRLRPLWLDWQRWPPDSRDG
jgi:TRAP transporter TAXI family solute receptor